MTDTVRIYVPRAGTSAARLTRPRSAVVSAGTGETRLFDVSDDAHGSLPRFADRVAQAAGRHVTRYPTIARFAVPATDVREVGEWDAERGVVRLTDPAALAAWLGVPEIPPAELEASGMRWEQRRTLERLEASPDPQARAQAAWLRRRQR